MVVAFCTSHMHARYFASQLNISTTLLRMCRSAIPSTWVTCHANMSVCVVMVIPRVSSHSGTSGGESLQNASTHDKPSRAVRCFQLIHWFFKTIIGELAHNDSTNGREARVYIW